MPPKKTTARPRFISIEGNIGSGKSTILKIIRENFPELTILDEPLSEWQNVGDKKDINLLGLYYQDPARWGFTFQIYAFMSRLTKWTEYSKLSGGGIRISERSLLSDRYIFASIMRDSNILDEAEHEIYLNFYDNLVKMNDIVDLHGVIYIRALLRYVPSVSRSAPDKARTLFLWTTCLKSMKSTKTGSTLATKRC